MVDTNLTNGSFLTMSELTANQQWTIVISCLALVVSGTSAFFSIRTGIRENQRINREKMNELMLKMIEADRTSDMRQSIVFSAQAVELIKKRPGMMGAMDYITTAEALFNAQDWEEARAYWEKGINRSFGLSEHLQIAVKRGYAERLFLMNDPEKGRDWYKASLKVVSNDRDFHKHLNAYTHRMWYVSESEYGLGNKSALAQEHYMESVNLYRIINNRTTKERGLQELEELRLHYNQQEPENRTS